jgi:CO/xanthine dehydrogenase FAD-binding subunit
MTDVENILVGKRLNGELCSQIESSVSRAVEYFPDERCARPYKMQVAGVLMRRAIADAIADGENRFHG